MTKVQKIWLGLSAAMFVIPEVMWGNLIQIFKISFLPIYKDVQLFTDKPLLAFLIIILEISGTLGCIYLLNRKKYTNNIYLKYIINIILVIILLALILSLFLSFVMSQISFP